MTEKKKRISDEFIGYKSVISSLLRKLTFISGPEIEDILQETFIRTYQSALQREIRFPKAFMVKTALRLAYKQKSQASKVDENVDLDELTSKNLALDDTEEYSGDPEREYIKLEEFRLMSRVINELPAQCRKVFIMKKIYGLSQRDIATAMRLSESTVEKHVAKGMLFCIRRIEKSRSNASADSSNQLLTLEHQDLGRGRR